MKELRDISQTLLGAIVKIETVKSVTVGTWYGYDTQGAWLLIGEDRVSIDWDEIVKMDAWCLKKGTFAVEK